MRTAGSRGRSSARAQIRSSCFPRMFVAFDLQEEPDGRARRRQRDRRRLCGIRASRARPRFDRHCRRRRSRLGRDGAESRPDPRLRAPPHRLCARERASQGEDARGAGGDGARNRGPSSRRWRPCAARRSGRDDGATGRGGRARAARGGLAHAFLHDAHLHGPRRRASSTRAPRRRTSRCRKARQ